MQHFGLKYTILMFIFRFDLLFFYFGASVKALHAGAITITTPLIVHERQWPSFSPTNSNEFHSYR